MQSKNLPDDNILIFFKKIIILFWTCWWLIALWTDIVGGLTHLKLISASFAPDLNYPALVAALKMYQAPFWLSTCLFMLIITWSLLCATAFVWTSLALGQGVQKFLARANIAFVISLSFWLCFFLADQMVMKFDLEENHMVQGGFQLLTFLSLYCLPNKFGQP